ncbi:VWA domain-containing protein [Hydrogenimonas urashimensis]|uniref:VWA domain-containing protein n=1 Tax=Hydrogenimonas urashimensis TaxID=2740515 RepID=UPI001916B1C9|nr:VWA domain-containing protein [Hydrogenimonas urashimensis]
MKFLFPEFIYLMLVPAGILFYLISTNKDVVERIFDEKTLQRLRISGDSLGRAGHNTLMFFAFFMMTLALARPVIDQGKERVEGHGIDLVIALDLSQSMRAADFYPNRFLFARQKLEDVLPRMPAGRIGIVGFTSASFIITPLTSDRDTVRFLLKRVSPDSVTVQGTDLSAALKGAARLLQKRPNKTVLLVTDGGDEEDISTLVKIAKENGMRVMVWMMASRQGAPVPVDGNGSVMKRNGEIVISRANVDLARLAESTGGIYVEATLSQEDEKRVGAFLQRLSREGETYEKTVEKRIELFYYPLALALLGLPFAFYSIGTGRGTFALLLLVPLMTFSQKMEAGVLDFMLIDKGEKAYWEGDFKKSTKAFEELVMHTPKSEIWFDLGNSYYRSGRYKMACSAYEKVVTPDMKVEQAKLYNLGNCYVKLGELQKAAELYRKALALGEDADARYNLEMVMKALKEMKRKKSGSNAKSRKKGREKNKRSSSASVSQDGGKRGAKSSKRSDQRKLSLAEEKKWMRLIEKQPMKPKLYPLIPPRKGTEIEPW